MFSSKFKYSSLILLLAVVVMFYSTALPFSAAVEPTYELVPVQIDLEELSALFFEYNGINQIYYSFFGMDGIMYTQQIQQDLFDASAGVGFMFSDGGFIDTVDNDLLFWGSDEYYVFELTYVRSVSMSFGLYLPFDFYIGTDTVFEYGMYTQPPTSENYTLQVFGGLQSVSDEIVFIFPGDYEFEVIPDFKSVFGLAHYSSRFVMSESTYEALNRGTMRISCTASPTSIISPHDYPSHHLMFGMTFVLDETQFTSGFLSFPIVYFKPFTIYVESPIAPTVEDYLTAITNPSPESAAEVERLEQELEEISEQLRQDASDLEVEKPDISDSVENLPSEVIEGMGEASETVLSPLMTIDLIATLFSVLFGVVALKLILFGSGTA